MNADSSLLEQRYRGAHPIATLWSLCSTDRWRLIIGAVFQIIKHSPVWIMPLIIAFVLDSLSNPATLSTQSLWFAFGFLALMILQNIPNQLMFMRMLSTTARNLELNLRAAISRRLQQLSITYLNRQNSGALQAKLIRDVESIQQLLMGVFEPVLIILATIVVIVIATASRAPWFLLFYAISVPLAVTVVVALRRPIQQSNAQLRHEVEHMSTRLSEMTQLLQITRAHGEEDYALDRVQQQLRQVRSAGLQLDWINAVFGSTAFVVMQLLSGLVLGLSVWLYLQQQAAISLGDIVLLTGYFNALVGSTLAFLNLMPQIAKGFEAIRSVGEILECPDLEQNEGKRVVHSVAGQIQFDHVDFAYESGPEAALHDICLTVNPGETIAIVGPSGAGKSTMLSLLIGFQRPTAGQILLDGQNMAALDLRTYRRFMSVVPQETMLFDGTIRENVTYGNRQVSEPQLQQALADANALEFVQQLPEGIDTMIGERGARLSGGQRQRLAIARALIRDPRVLVLDEATSALDPAAEAEVQEALQRLMRGRTTFVVAHRLSTVRHADRIVVLQQGRIVELGNHDELMQQEGLYYRLQRYQMA